MHDGNLRAHWRCKLRNLTLPARSRKVTCHMHVTCHVTRTNRLLSFEHGKRRVKTVQRIFSSSKIQFSSQGRAKTRMDLCLDEELSLAIKPGIIH